MGNIGLQEVRMLVGMLIRPSYCDPPTSKWEPRSNNSKNELRHINGPEHTTALHPKILEFEHAPAPHVLEGVDVNLISQTPYLNLNHPRSLCCKKYSACTAPQQLTKHLPSTRGMAMRIPSGDAAIHDPDPSAPAGVLGFSLLFTLPPDEK